ncbi:hypothetical protein OSB04_027592 [Centaurea solstitialis]|uniref:Tyrosinase copper-binding domain-containing protein n=1 Tax=Centaurea solstitialis TaxID=347529 RepID=A0AA38WAD9_9ASTR|nr:hypothetical protein OSB04_027592 [Centaurea solstitialis]
MFLYEPSNLINTLKTTKAMSSLAPPPTIVVSGSSFFSFRNPNTHRPVSCRSGGRRNLILKPSCKILDDGNHHKHDRRDVLLGLGSLYTAFASNSLAFADPIQPGKCGPPDNLPEDVNPINCCPPEFRGTIIDFTPPPPSKPLRVRPAAHLVDSDYIHKFIKAIEIMKSLPEDHPHSFMQQAAVHCAYCNDSYKQQGHSNLNIQVHKSWLFFPFHRQYLYFFEKICGKLIGDPDFAIPFWNWDAPDGMEIPGMYTHRESPLYDALRNADHQPPCVVDLQYDTEEKHRSREDQVVLNLSTMHRQMISGANTTSLFMGNPYHAGDRPCAGSGTIEGVPHDTLHTWTGDKSRPYLENMGTFYSAARDPMFYGHHANVDRMWYLWKTIDATRQDFGDKDWLETFFYFYDENAQMVRFKVKDCLDTEKLGYTYQKVDIPWKNAKPTPRLIRPFKPLLHDFPFEDDIFPARLDKPIKVLARRPNKSRRSREEKRKKEEILVIEGIEVKSKGFVKFDVLMNEEDERLSGPDKTEFAGSFVNVTSNHRHGKNLKTKLRLGISELLEDLNAADDPYLLVTLDPKFGCDAVSVQGIKIEFEEKA